MDTKLDQELSTAELTVSFDCIECGKAIDADVENVRFDWANDESGGEAVSDNTVICKHCGKSHLVQIIDRTDGKSAKLLERPWARVALTASRFEDLYDDFIDEFMPGNAYEVYLRAQDDIREVDLKSVDLSGSRNVLLRMIYLQYVVMLESYLSDRLINVVLDDEKKLKKFVGDIPALRDQDFKFILAASNPDFVQRTVLNHLQKTSFHDLAKVDKFYRSALNVSLFKDEKNRAEMIEIIQKRHNIVHRNGRDEHGVLIALTVLDVQRVRGLVDEMVRRVEDAYKPYHQMRRLRFSDDDIF